MRVLLAALVVASVLGKGKKGGRYRPKPVRPSGDPKPSRDPRPSTGPKPTRGPKPELTEEQEQCLKDFKDLYFPRKNAFATRHCLKPNRWGKCDERYLEFFDEGVKMELIEEDCGITAMKMPMRLCCVSAQLCTKAETESDCEGEANRTFKEWSYGEENFKGCCLNKKSDIGKPDMGKPTRPGRPGKPGMGKPDNQGNGKPSMPGNNTKPARPGKPSKPNKPGYKNPSKPGSKPKKLKKKRGMKKMKKLTKDILKDRKKKWNQKKNKGSSGGKSKGNSGGKNKGKGKGKNEKGDKSPNKNENGKQE